MKRPVIKTRRLILRPLIETDYEEFVDAFANRLPQQNRWDTGHRTKKECTIAIFRKLMARQNKMAEADDCYIFYAFENRSGKLIGHIDFDIFVRSTHQFANFGYQIYNRHWGKGFGQEAAAAGLRIGFKHLKINRLEAAINLDNKKSIRLAKTIGMRREGIKKRYWFEFGHWVDHLIYVANPEDLGLRATKPILDGPPSPKRNR